MPCEKHQQRESFRSLPYRHLCLLKLASIRESPEISNLKSRRLDTDVHLCDLQGSSMVIYQVFMGLPEVKKNKKKQKKDTQHSKQPSWAIQVEFLGITKRDGPFILSTCQTWISHKWQLFSRNMCRELLVIDFVHAGLKVKFRSMHSLWKSRHIRSLWHCCFSFSFLDFSLSKQLLRIKFRQIFDLGTTSPPLLHSKLWVLSVLWPWNS